MDKKDLITCFQDTLEKSYSWPLKLKTAKAQMSNKVYKEGFVARVPMRKEHTHISVEACTSFVAAKKYHHLGRVAVLNFANPVNPGGGVQLGAMAQEECLCRSSNLYSCLNASNVRNDYYAYNRELKNSFYSDRLIYTKNVTVFKDDSDVPKMMPKEEWFDVDIITCAAPYLVKRKYTNSTALLSLFKKRIKNICEAAKDNKVDVIILGAFGCGAFKNPPSIVADAFDQVIIEQSYSTAFRKIVFAIKPTSADCPNLMAFSNQFSEYEGKCELLLEEESLDRIPAFIKNVTSISESSFASWQISNKYFGKQFSVLGDSISTLDGYHPKGYKAFYNEENSRKTGVAQMSDTWWDKVISFFGGELLVNNSWSGSRVTKLPQREQLFPSGCAEERTSALHINDIYPDVIIVYLGINDWAAGALTGKDTHILGVDDKEYFDYAYNYMLKKLRKNYPKSEIWCCTLCETYVSKRPDFSFPHKYAGIHIEEYNNIIRDEALQNKSKLIDLVSYNVPYDSIDGIHPSSDGMSAIATMVIRTMTGNETDFFQ